MRFVTLPAAMMFALAAPSATFVAQGRGNGQIRKTSASTTAAAFLTDLDHDRDLAGNTDNGLSEKSKARGVSCRVASHRCNSF